ncbi:PrsW family intramembrane metalloprotease [Candidatus Gracilibacteria bacterium]|nr:PrsW family intramembrane metalloprotease [Candidatus Gracilibacteria bacterium]
MLLLNLFLIALFLTFPLLLWGYGTLYLSQNIWNRNRFIFGMIGGAIAVAVIILFGKFKVSESNLLTIISFLIMFGSIGSIAWWATKSGSPFIGGFLRKVLLLHSLIFVFVCIAGVLIEDIFPHSNSLLVLLTSIGGFLLAASIEEGVKHISTLGLTSKEFRFTRRDFLLFTFFVTLGFSTIENAIYLFGKIDSSPWSILLIGISRILFSLTIHVFAASICVMLWWKALSYKIFSYKYVLFFLLGYIAATVVHGLYNFLLVHSYIFPLFVLTGVGYFSFTQWLNLDERG